MLLQALAAHKEGDFEKALDTYESALKYEESAKGFRLYGTLLKELGQVDAATDALRKALRCEMLEHDKPGGGKDDHPGTHDGLYLRHSSIASGLAFLLAKAGNTEEAKKLAIEAIKADKTDIEAGILLILILVNQGRVGEAVNRYNTAPKSVRCSFQVCQSLSGLLAKANRFEESIQIRNHGRSIPQFRLSKIQNHDLVPLNTKFMVPHLGAQPHPAVELLETRAEAGNSPFYVKTTDATILSGEWFVISRSHEIFIDMNHGTPTGDPSYYLFQPNISEFLLPQPMREVLDKAILVGGDPNYYHWVIEFLPRLLAIAKTPALNDYPILVHEKLLPYQREGLALAGISEERVKTLEYPACYPCKELILPLFPPDSPEMFSLRSRSSAITWLRQLISPATGKRKRFYISRMDSKRRKIIREDVLTACLEKEGFEILVLAGMSQKEQIEKFNQAEMIVGGHGAGMGNIAFTPENCRIVEIVIPSWHNQNFESLARIRGHKYFSVQCRTYCDEPTSPIFSDFYLTDRAIDKILDIVRSP